MEHISIQIPEEILIDLHEDRDIFENYVKQKIAIDLYIERKVSLGYCAELAGMAKEDFIKLLGKNKVSIFSFVSDDEFEEEATNA